MAHPCEGHRCDNCAICQAGVCCLTVPSGEAFAGDAPDHRLREAVREEAATATGLAQLIRAEVAVHLTVAPPIAALPPGETPAATQLLTIETEVTDEPAT